MPDTSKYAETFDLIDQNKDGLISAAELTALMTAMGDQIDDSAADKAVEIFDQDGDGQINLEEFAGYLASRGA